MTGRLNADYVVVLSPAFSFLLNALRLVIFPERVLYVRGRDAVLLNCELRQVRRAIRCTLPVFECIRNPVAAKTPFDEENE